MGVELPTVNLATFANGPDWRRKSEAKKLSDSLIAHGFVKVIDHGITNNVVDDIFKWAIQSGKLFRLTPDQKAKFAYIGGAKLQRGWSNLYGESTAKLRQANIDGAPAGKLTDEKEHFDCGTRDDTRYPNLWPDDQDLPGFQDFMETYYDLGQKVALQIIEACEVGLNLAPGTLADRCTPSASELRLNHYPSVSISKLKEGLTKRTWPHCDFGVITLLFQDEVGGLELEDRSNGTFAPIVRENPYEMIVSVSETLQRLTNDVVRGGVHQVTNPMPMKNLEEGDLPERYSCVFFLKAHFDTPIGPLPAFVSPQQPSKYPDISSLAFQEEATKILY